MDKYEFRRQRLIELRDQKCWGNAAELARKISREPSYVTRMLMEPGKDGRKRMGEDIIEDIERKMNVPGWFTPPKEGADTGADLSPEAMRLGAEFDRLNTPMKIMIRGSFQTAKIAMGDISQATNPKLKKYSKPMTETSKLKAQKKKE